MRTQRAGGEAIAVVQSPAVLRRALLLTGVLFGFWLLAMLFGAGHASAAPAASADVQPVRHHALLTPDVTTRHDRAPALVRQPVQAATASLVHVVNRPAVAVHRTAATASPVMRRGATARPQHAVAVTARTVVGTASSQAAATVGTAVRTLRSGLHTATSAAGSLPGSVPPVAGIVPLLPSADVPAANGTGVTTAPTASRDLVHIGRGAGPLTASAASIAALTVLGRAAAPTPAATETARPVTAERASVDHPEPAHHVPDRPIRDGDDGGTPSTGNGASGSLSAADLADDAHGPELMTSTRLAALTASARGAGQPEPSVSPD
jgi:hypothetical protein